MATFRWKPVALSALVLSVLMGCHDGKTETPASDASQAVTQAPAATTTIHTARGEMTVPLNPAKVAVFDMTSLDDLQALGVPVIGAPKKVLVPYLQQTLETANNIGTLFEPDLEALNALKPQLIIVSNRTAPKYDELSSIAPTLDMTDSGQDLIKDGLNLLDSYGKLFQQEPKARALHEQIQKLFTETQDAVKGKGNGLILLVNGGKLSAFGPASRFGWIHNEVGIPAADTQIQAAPHGQSVSFEYVQKVNPDWLFIIDRTSAIGAEGKSAQAVLNNDLVRQTKAWKAGHVVYLSAASYLAAGGVQQMKTDLTNIKAAFTN
ncbi:siderophore ABC transporter substrate-binding protein [Neisseriaceae bacterium ESL0693]|nr:siderophore ABC transporter substrate-binding protein [Neisseriaceae bacterium ESL0693]